MAVQAVAQPNLGASADNLLAPEKAFRFSARMLDETAIEVSFAIADGYYMYRDKFRFTAEGNPGVRLGAVELPRGIRHKDEFFGEVETYRKQVRIRVPAQGEGRFDLKVVSQGCADRTDLGTHLRRQTSKALKTFLHQLPARTAFHAPNNADRNPSALLEQLVIQIEVRLKDDLSSRSMFF